jgi:hypothetical protein
VIATILFFVPAASATWGTSFHSLRKTPTLGEPECVALAAKQVVCVAQSQQRSLMVNEFSNNTWSGWTNLPGVGVSDASCVNDGAGKVMCGARSATNTLVATVFDGANWSDFIDSEAQIFAAPSCALLRDTKVFCTSRTLNGALTGSTFNSATSTWGKFQTAAATTTDAPGCAGDNDGDVICAVDAIVNNANTTVVNRFDGSKWEGFLTLNTISSASPLCTSLGLKGQVECFDRGSDDTIFANRFASGLWSTSNWSGWRRISGSPASAKISCALLSVSSGSLACAIRSWGDSSMYAATYDGTSWAGFKKVGTKPIIAGPGCAVLSGGKAICVVVGISNQAGSVTGP